MMRIAVVTASDKGAKGERRDESGPLAGELLREFGEVVAYVVVPDEQPLLAAQLRRLADEEGAELILTTGGTGLGPRDVTPEATLEVVDRVVPGIPEAIRALTLAKTPRAMLSRAVAGVRGQTLIINLPGSPKGVAECLEVVKPVLAHAVEIVTGRGGECARP